jgi:hypothetical protein
MMRSFAPFSFACVGLLFSQVALADVVEITDGSRLNGEIVKIHEGKLVLKTSYAGTLEIAMSDVVAFSRDEPASVRFADGSVAVGPVRAAGAGRVTVASSGGSVSGATSEVVAAWAPGETDPAIAAVESQLRKWRYEAAVALTGKIGNTDKSDYAATFRAVLEGPRDRLTFYSGYNFAQAGDPGVTTAEEMIGGVNYTNFFAEHYGWYVRQELERDKFENLKFRSTTAAGFTYRPINEALQKLEFFGGLSLRYEGYGFDLNDDGVEDKTGSESFPGLDFGLKHYWRFADWGEMNNALTYNPSFDDFGNYRLDHLSTVDIPLGSSDFWKLRLSLQNQYNSDVPAGAENLDTTYALSLLLNWR